MNIRRTTRQLLMLCRSAVRAQAYDGELADVKDLYTVAHNHGLSASLYYTLYDIVEDKESLCAFREAHDRMRHIVITQSQQLSRLFRLFEAGGIRLLHMPLENMHAADPEGISLLDERVRLFVDASALTRAEALLLDNGFSQIREDRESRLYLLSPYFVLDLSTIPSGDGTPHDQGLCRAWERATKKDGYALVYEMTERDSYILLLCRMYAQLPDHTPPIAQVLRIGMLYERLCSSGEDAIAREWLCMNHLDSFAEVIRRFYGAWIYEEELTPTLAVLAELTAMANMYKNLEEYLRESNEGRSSLAYLFLPYVKMRLAHPVCLSPLLYPLGLVLRVIHLCARKLERVSSATNASRGGIADATYRTLWKAVNVNID